MTAFQDPPWLAAARKQLGVRETPGPKSTALIVSWARALKGWWRGSYTDDATPWCAVFANQMLFEADLDRPGTTRASDFATWGVPLEQPSLGCVLVFKRPSGGHVGFYVGEAVVNGKPCYRVLGGNQGDAVSEIWIEQSRCVAKRWPSPSFWAKSGPIQLAATGAAISHDEA